mmetsp:Transcript_9791/g.32357  ORF Transcript_9791/g.32357 Transcript_9791/m.32357 type:complete len:263 (+) Transcript_9791:464-1252(+)
MLTGHVVVVVLVTVLPVVLTGTVPVLTGTPELVVLMVVLTGTVLVLPVLPVVLLSSNRSAAFRRSTARTSLTGGASKIRRNENRDRTRFSSISTASCLDVTPTTAAWTWFCCNKSITAYSNVCLLFAPPLAKRSNASSTKITARPPCSKILNTSLMNPMFSIKPAVRENKSSSPAAQSWLAISRIPTFSSECSMPFNRTTRVFSAPCFSMSSLSALSSTVVLPLPQAPTNKTLLFCSPRTVSPKISTKCCWWPASSGQKCRA